ncbi:hypothetical protein FRC12_000409 [Ceratobasidium sp. 428]|nr:hypothetical protein FRC12_000409 [Ceratobasidium sp. 428]
MHSIFETPELISMICADLPPCLMLVSKQFFHGILPYHWNQTAMRNLFMRGLIPATWTRRDGKIHASTSQTLTPENMARFHFYAPFIKVLFFDSPLEIEDWDPLITYSQKIKLLPNLVTLECWEPDLQVLSMSLSDSTRIIHFSQHPISLTRNTLAFIASRCSTIRELCLHPMASKQDVVHLTVEDIPQQLFTPISEFRELRTLSTNTAVLQSHALKLISQLPNLVDLHISDGFLLGARPNLRLSHALPANAFPSLRTLRIVLDTFQDVKRFWDLIPLKMLSEVCISIKSASSNDQAQFIPSLCHGSPQIRGLSLTFPSESGDGNLYSIQADMFECLRNLPLDRFFSVSCAKLDFENAWDQVAASWPLLGDIRCTDQPARVQDLMMLSTKLPSLSSVRCDFDLTHMASVIERGWQPIGDPTRYSKLEQLIVIRLVELQELASESSPYDLYDLAKFFAYFWPNANFRAPIYGNGPIGDDERVYQNELFDMFTNLIETHAHSFRNS